MTDHQHSSADKESAPLRLCGYCKTWNRKPCGEQCCWSPTDPTNEPAATEGEYWREKYNECWDRARSDNDALKSAALKALNYIENTENELGIKLSSGDALREALR